jgi:hypothetical protein
MSKGLNEFHTEFSANSSTVLYHDCVEEIVLFFIQIIVFIFSCCRIEKKQEKTKTLYSLKILHEIKINYSLPYKYCFCANVFTYFF